jgi:hypothetical protein
VVRVLFTGSRRLDQEDRIARFVSVVVEGLAQRYGSGLVIVHGNARGLDRMVDGIARGMGITVDPFQADWDGRGKIAGPERNQRMLDAGVDLVVAVKPAFNWKLDRGGTEDMVRRAHDAGVMVYVVEPFLP